MRRQSRSRQHGNINHIFRGVWVGGGGGGYLVAGGPEVSHEARGESQAMGGLQGGAVDVCQQATGHGGAQTRRGREGGQGVPLQHQGALFRFLFQQKTFVLFT